MKKKNNLKKGFTLLETLIAIFILTLSITGPVYIASVAFRNTIDSRDNISAQYIAEEVIEVIRNKRDKNALALTTPSPTTWVSDLGLGVVGNCLNESGVPNDKCTMKKDVILDQYIFESCGSDICPNISFDPLKDVVYGHSDAVSFSKFTREFYFEKETLTGSDLTSIKIVVNIKWNDRGSDKVYTLEERLYNTNYNQYFITD